LTEDSQKEEATKFVEVLEKSTRNVCRYFFHNKKDLLKLQELMGEKRNMSVMGFMETLKDLVGVINLKMTTSKEEQESINSQIELLNNSVFFFAVLLSRLRR
jgi:hypothetical protein